MPQFPIFKSMVWRSLTRFRDVPSFRYEYLDAYRLVDIFFNRDPGTPSYETPRELVDLELLIMVLGLADLPNKLLPGLIVQALTLRRDADLPTWVFAPFSRTKVHEVYGPDVATLLGDIGPVTPAPDKTIAVASPFSPRNLR